MLGVRETVPANYFACYRKNQARACVKEGHDQLRQAWLSAPIPSQCVSTVPFVFYPLHQGLAGNLEFIWRSRYTA